MSFYKKLIFLTAFIGCFRGDLLKMKKRCFLIKWIFQRKILSINETDKEKTYQIVKADIRLMVLHILNSI